MSQPQNNDMPDVHAPFEPQTLQLQIMDLQTGQPKVVLRLPVGLVVVAQRLGAQLLPAGKTLDDVLAQARSGGSRLAWEDSANNERFELTLE